MNVCYNIKQTHQQRVPKGMRCFFDKKTTGSAGGEQKLSLWREKTPCVIMELRSANLTKNNTGGIIMTRDDINSLAHSKWNCKYHVVFAPKYRRMIICNKIKADIGKKLRKLCGQKEIEIIEAELCPDHVQCSSPRSYCIIINEHHSFSCFT